MAGKRDKSARRSGSLAAGTSDILSGDFDRMFSNFWNMPSLFGYEPTARFPRVDLIDKGKELLIKADLPGVKKEDIKVNVSKNMLVLQADSKEKQEEQGKDYYYRERSASKYYRAIPLPAEVDSKSADAKFEDGTLVLRLKKVQSGQDIKVK